ncbi:hypothetical protein PIB30_028146 [Stylosanthes scabra]|uniref:Uncharacterized protein n=1 Tax=Stylosanthes scabra TaxID=79078 RepID=A0ABU6XCN0_9FABA|nr:hypothetical protein [Stylosanthes scabra]
MDKNSIEEDNVSLVQAITAPHEHSSAEQSPFQLGTNAIVAAKRHKIQKLKHMARRVGSDGTTSNVTGIKRTTTGAGLDSDLGNDVELDMNAADGEKGANPVMAPTTQ